MLLRGGKLVMIVITGEGAHMVEAAGVEPASENRETNGPTCVVTVL